MPSSKALYNASKRSPYGRQRRGRERKKKEKCSENCEKSSGNAFSLLSLQRLVAFTFVYSYGC